MSELPQHEPSAQAPDDDQLVEEVDGLPVLTEHPPAVVSHEQSTAIARPGPYGLQAAAVAATGLVAGAAVVGLMRHRRRRRRSSRRRGHARDSRRVAGELVQIVGSRSLLVDVHLLGGRN